VKVISYDYIMPVDSGEVIYKTRNVLYIKCRILNDTLHLFLNHWPSRRGGVLAGESQRLRIAKMLIEKADSVVLADGRDTKIIFAGDFNAVPEDEVIGKLSGYYGSGLSMMNLSDRLPDGSGTYRYQGTWEMIDQVIVSESVIASKRGLHASPGSLEIFNPSFLLQDDPNYPGQTPFSTYRGYKYQGGYSDHLPVLLELK
jgi:endonuclease/exonuclease/phosphatase family metal-dependent hydrolase